MVPRFPINMTILPVGGTYVTGVPDAVPSEQAELSHTEQHDALALKIERRLAKEHERRLSKEHDR